MLYSEKKKEKNTEDKRGQFLINFISLYKRLDGTEKIKTEIK